MNAADVFVKALEAEGVQYVFGLPGEENLHLLESIRKSSITFVATHHEQAAGFMAATVGRLTGTPGVCLSTLGPGATNLVTAVAYSQLGAMPALFVTGQKPIKKGRQGYFQIINTVEMMRPITKFTRQVVHAPLVSSIVREAFKMACEERPGAVHIELPEDIADETVDDVVIFGPRKIQPTVAQMTTIDSVVKLIEKAKRPIVLVGAGANRKGVSTILTDFVEKTKIPFFTTQMGKGVIDERSEQYLGTAALSEGDYLHQLVRRADLIINVGHDTVEKPPFIMKPGNKQMVIHLNFSSATQDVIYSPQVEVLGDIGNTILEITRKIVVQSHWNFSVFEKMKKKMEAEFAKMGKVKSFPYRPYGIIQELRNSLGEEDIVVLDNGMYKIWFARHYPTYRPNSLLLDNALATMGAGLPSAIAAKLLCPEKKVICVCGDGGFVMNSQELATAARLKLDLIIMILRDDAYGMVEWKQEAMKLSPFGLRFVNPDFVALAEAYGAKGYRVKKAGDLKSLLLRVSKQRGIQIIDLPIDYSDNRKLSKTVSLE